MLIASFATYGALVVAGTLWTSVEAGVALVDVILLGTLLVIALTTNRVWPLWATAAQLVGTMTHLAIWADPYVVPRAYALAQPFWAYPALIALALGTWNVRKARLAGRILKR